VDRSIGSPWTRSVVGVCGPGVSVFRLPVRSRVFQSCVLSPILFSVAIYRIMRKTIGNKRRGMSLLEDLDFADDVTLVSSTRDQLQRRTSDLSLAAKQLV